jgi:septal ring factor EnvC (AmiA/AmiB activator)
MLTIIGTGGLAMASQSQIDALAQAEQSLGEIDRSLTMAREHLDASYAALGALDRQQADDPTEERAAEIAAVHEGMAETREQIATLETQRELLVIEVARIRRGMAGSAGSLRNPIVTSA